MKKYYVFLLVFMLLAGSLSIFNSCEEEGSDDDNLDNIVNSIFGWFGSENDAKLPDDINLSTDQNKNLPKSVNLTDKFPPVGNQGQYGTCVAWALAYNLKTYLEGVDRKWSSSDLSKTENQFSPKDLFWAIPNGSKSVSCNGTNFENAFNVMVNRGVAPLSVVKYENLGDCSSSPSQQWTNEAGKYKIENYRQIEIDITTIKNYIYEGRPVAIGAKLGDGFVKWNSDNVLTSDNNTYNGQHANHAMVLAGYDDNMGPNGAFRVINSWGPGWGNKGYIWIDYNFFVKSFCFAAFVAKNKTSNPDSDNDNQVDDDKLVSGQDLCSWGAYDEQNEEYSDPLYRVVYYDVYNVGTDKVQAANKWNILYIYYNAYNANDYGILLYDYYTNEYGSYGDNGNLNNQSGSYTPGISGNWWTYIDVPGGSSVAQAVYGSEDSYFIWSYIMPNTLNGYYYLVLISDGFDVIKENNEDNNYYFLTLDNGDPIPIQNGVIYAKKSLAKKANSKPGLFAKSPSPSVVSKYHPNAYSPKEIKNMILTHKRSGELNKKALQYVKNKKFVKGIARR